LASKIYPDAPRVAVGAVIIHDHKVLLVLRKQAPSKDLWAIPGGGVELGETLGQAVEREVFEETGLIVKSGEIIFSFEAIQRDAEGRVQYHYVIIDLLAEPLDPDQPLQPADDAANAAWFSLGELERGQIPVSPPTLALLRQMMKE
jgi:ADP-ribose pyrophosphatase YjhB (NUDIX family)